MRWSSRALFAPRRVSLRPSADGPASWRRLSTRSGDQRTIPPQPGRRDPTQRSPIWAPAIAGTPPAPRRAPGLHPTRHPRLSPRPHPGRRRWRLRSGPRRQRRPPRSRRENPLPPPSVKLPPQHSRKRGSPRNRKLLLWGSGRRPLQRRRGRCRSCHSRERQPSGRCRPRPRGRNRFPGAKGGFAVRRRRGLGRQPNQRRFPRSSRRRRPRRRPGHRFDCRSPPGRGRRRKRRPRRHPVRRRKRRPRRHPVRGRKGRPR